MTAITSVRLTAINIARTTGLVCGHVIVELTADDGLVGLGEMSDFQHLPQFHVDVADLQETLEALLVGLDVEAAHEATRRLEAAFPAAGNLYDKAAVIRCGVDIALWDLRGKARERSVADLLGGPVRPSLPVAYPVFRQRSPRDVEANLDLVEERLERGHTLFRVYVGRDLDLDERFLRAARDRFGDRVTLKSLDFSNLLDAVEAVRFVERTKDLGYELVEAPAREGDLEGLGYVRRTTLVPVSEHVYDGRAALELVRHRAVDVFNVGLFALGGITPALRVTAIAEAAGLRCLVGTTQELAIGTAAAAHFGVAAPTASVAADPVGPLLYRGDVVTEPLVYRDGALLAPGGPGLGVALDRARLAEAAGPLRWRARSIADVVDRVGGAS